MAGMVALGGQSVFYTFGDAATDDFSEEMVFFVPAARGVELSR